MSARSALAVVRLAIQNNLAPGNLLPLLRPSACIRKPPGCTTSDIIAIARHTGFPIRVQKTILRRNSISSIVRAIGSGGASLNRLISSFRRVPANADKMFSNTLKLLYEYRHGP
jgi:hypothetical protein